MFAVFCLLPAWYDETLRLKDSPTHRAGRSRVRAALGQLEAALEDAAAAVAAEPQNPDYLVARAMLLERLGRYQEAIEDYGSALPGLRAAGVPTFECLFNRGYCHKLLGRTEEAIAELEAAALQNTTSMTVRTVLGALYLSKRRYARAADVFAVVAQQQYGSAAAASNAALAAYLAVTADYDDSSPATRAASLNEQRQRAARTAALASARKPPAIAQLTGDSVANTPRDGEDDGGGGGGAAGSGSRRSLAKQVTKHREAAAAAAAAAAAGGGGGGGPGNLSARSLRARAAPSVAALLDEEVAADEGALPSPRPGRRGGTGAANTASTDAAGAAGAADGDSSEDELDGGGGGGGGGGPGGPEPPPTVYLPADPRQWAADVVRENEAQAVWDADKKLVLEQALKGFDTAMANQRALAKERAAAEAEAEAVGRPVERPGRHVLDSDTTAVEVGEAGDVPGGLLVVVDRRLRTPGTAVVHDREIEGGELQYNRGLVLLALGRLAEAAADLDAALAANPHHAHYPYYQCHLDMGNYPEAIDDLTTALEALPHSALLLFGRGGAQLAFAAGDVRAAAEDLQRAAEVCKGTLRGEGPLWESRKFMSSGSGTPDLSPALWYQLGCARARCGAASEAVSAFRRAAGLMPGHPVFLHELAKACQVAGDAAAALTHFNAVLKLQPRNARALLRRGLALKCLKRYDEAAADLLAARRLEPANPLMQLDMRSLGSVSFIELCAPGDEDDAYVMIKY
ncbi:hypothetical protein CHLRE_05g238260v5 [Chlamydomonas reinhardtii]|uniref:Uncharacterized protein n=1 Tax=Chlamydomonas reinhardtii TaxID=3055 RepID=A0A2K3DSY9_CHLRE|nr:uncharacterized protein CHLRE_05g238260v5 [Chlamydomonas reinhardtii]PNW83652.1 hypothetical protein CHLRE_05g238260v5 [Chlamydomonas reinhardtii]